MIIAFEHWTASSNRMVGQIIRQVQGHDYTHVELIFEQYDWVTLSARRREDGVYIKPYQDVYLQPQLWQAYRLPIGNESPLYQKAMLELGKQFNYQGIFEGQLLKRAASYPSNRFCSEVTYSLLKGEGIPLPEVAANTVTPKTLHQWVKMLNYPLVELPKQP